MAGPFDAHIDQRADDERFDSPRPPAHSKLDAHVDSLPTELRVCMREAADAPPSAVTDGDPILAECDRTDVLSRGGGDPLPSTPLSIHYKSTAPTRVTADIETEQADRDDGDRLHTNEMHTVVDELPAELRADVLAPKEATGGDPARKLEAAYKADAAIDGVNLSMRNRRGDDSTFPGSLYLDTKLRGIPSAIGAVADTSHNVLKQVEFHACEFDFVGGDCNGPQQSLGSVEFLVRPQRARGSLPPRPADIATTHVSLIKRFANHEIAGHIADIRHVAFRTRDADDDGAPDGTLGVLVDAGVGGPFDTYMDQVVDDERFVERPSRASVVDTHVASLPEQFTACIREAKDAAPGSVPHDDLLDPCDETEVLGRGGSDPLTTTPMSIAYSASVPTRVSADITTEAEDPADGRRRHTDDLSVDIDEVPSDLRADIIPAKDADGASPARKLELQYKANAAIDRVDFTMRKRRTDNTPFKDSSYIDATVRGIPGAIAAQVDSSRGVAKSIGFHACEFDFVGDGCEPGTEDEVDRVDFLLRPQKERGSLPPRPSSLVPTHVSLIKRFDNSEIEGRVDAIRRAVVHQRDANDDGKPDGTLGLDLSVGNHDPFDAHIDQLGVDEDHPADPQPNISQKVTAQIRNLPESIKACVRQASEALPPAPPGDDVLLAPCDATDVLGHGPGNPLDNTPLSVHYDASSPTKVTAEIESLSNNLDDGDRPTVSRLRTVVDKVPGQMRVDMVPGVAPEPGIAGRKMEFAYDASDLIDNIDLEVENRRESSLCVDPRRNRRAMCLSAHIDDLPAHMDASMDPDETKGDIAFNSSNPSPGDSKMSIGPVRLESTSPEPGTTPMMVDLDIDDITPQLRAQIKKVADGDGDGKLDMGRVTFATCETPPCASGIGKVAFKATNAIVESMLPVTPPLTGAPEPGINHELSFAARGTPFRAEGVIRDLRELRYDALDSTGAPSAVRTVRAAFGDGSGDKLRAYLDTDDGSDAMNVDMLMRDLPLAINLCMRGATSLADLNPTTPATPYCERQHANSDAESDEDKMAMQLKLDTVGATRPDIDVRKLLLTQAGGTRILAGSVKIDDLGERIDVLSGSTAGPDHNQPVILVEGHPVNDDTTLDDVVGRITFDLRNVLTAPPAGAPFPWSPLDAGSTDPESDARNDDTSPSNPGRNYAKLMTAGGTLRVMGSIPKIKQIGMRPEVCDPSDPRYPPAGLFTNPHKRPKFSCVSAIFAQERPLGIAVRTKDVKTNQVLALDDGHVDSMPGGDGGLKATLVTTPDDMRLAPVCKGATDAAAPDYCRPVQISIEAPQDPGQESNLQAKLAIGDQALLSELEAVEPHDPISRDRLDYEQAPRHYARRGVRLKVGSKVVGDDTATAVRGGLKLELPNFLDIDPMTSYSCKHDEEANPGDCSAADVSATSFNGFGAGDIFFKLSAADDAHDGVTYDNPDDPGYLGRVALLVHTFADKPTQLIVTGSPDPDPDHNHGGTSNFNPEHPAGPGEHDLGMLLPAHTDARVFIRQKFEAPNEGDGQSQYFQVDGRVNVPLSLALRMNNDPMGQARGGITVPSVSMAVNNAPGLAPDAPDYSKPTFRVRAELLAQRPGPPLGAGECNGIGYAFGGSGGTAGFGSELCAVLPDPDPAWVNVALNFDPDGVGLGDPPARTVDAHVHPRGASNDVELRGFKDVNGSDGPVGKGEVAHMSAQAGLRLDPFDFGIKLGLGLGIIGMYFHHTIEGDMLLDFSAADATRTRMSHRSALGMEMLSEGGPTAVKTDWETMTFITLKLELLFGLIHFNILDLAIGPNQQPIDFQDCSDPGAIINPFGGSYNAFAIGSGEHRRAVMAFGVPSEADAALANAGFGIISQILSPFWCLSDLHDVTERVTASRPAPAFSEPDRPVDDMTPAVPVTAPAAPPSVPDPRADVTIGDDDGVPESADTVVVCNQYTAKTLRIHGDGVLRVGRETETVPSPVPGQPDIACDGGVRLDIDRLIIEDGGRLDAIATRNLTDGPGAPGSGVGGGAGHVSTGGASGAGGGPGGGSYGSGDPPTFGSRGRLGSGGAPRGWGGGRVGVNATDFIRVEAGGKILARGGPSAHASTSGCAASGAGGGSGGGIVLNANRVTLDGTVSASGGTGGNGGNGGGGGSGGRVEINAIIQDGALEPVADGGAGGVTDGSCSPGPGNDGGAGGAGEPDLGETFDRAATVTLADGSPTDFVQGDATLHIKAMQAGGGRLHVVVCRRSVDPGTVNPYDQAASHPIATTLPIPLFHAGGTDCRSRHFSGPNVPGSDDEYQDTSFHWNSLPDGYHSFFAVAAKPNPVPASDLFPAIPDLPPNFNDCIGDPTNPFYSGRHFEDYCVFQTAFPERSTARIGSDVTAPTAPVSEPVNGTHGCAGDRDCLATSAGLANIVATDNHSGVASVRCSINGGPFDIPCDPGNPVAIPLGGDGTKDVSLRVVDRAGNATVVSPDDFVRWHVDSVKPDKPVVTVSPVGPEVNSWYSHKPNVSVSAHDPGASASGFPDADAITLTVDDVGSECGAPGPGATASCNITETEPHVPTKGLHRFSATAVDLAGNISEAADESTMKVDNGEPRTELFLGPSAPDGANGWYETRPVFAFAGGDRPGESGITVREAAADNNTPSGIFYSIDGGPFVEFRSDADAINRLANGTHSICWYGVDVAGNAEVGGAPTAGNDHCVTGIKVDAATPTPTLALTPAAPDGANGWYDSVPTFAITTSDSGGSGVDASGATPPSGTFYSIDGSAYHQFDPGAANELDDGDHEVCYYAVDRASNGGSDLAGADPSCRRVKVDTQEPEHPNMHLDPALPDGRSGWYRTRPGLTFSVRDANERNGSGVTLGPLTAPSKLRFRVNGGPYTTFDPNASYVLGDGDYDVCFYAIDIAGNGSVSPTTYCERVKIDSTPPTALDPIAPALPDGSNGWYVAKPTVSPAGTDPAGGSGLDGVEYQVDGDSWTTAAPFAVDEGEHEVRVRAFDVAGNAAPLGERVVRVDVSRPSSKLLTFPPRPNPQGWYRVAPVNSIGSYDGRDGSGPDGATFSVDGEPSATYLAPFAVGEGVRSVAVRARDVAGLAGGPDTSVEKVDLTPPAPKPIDPAPLLGLVDIPQIALLPGQSMPFRFDVPDNLGKVKVRVVVFNSLLGLVRELEVPGSHPGGFRDSGPGTISWNVRDAANKGVPPGIYHYRVTAIDQAGNSASSTESVFKLVILGLLPR